tara:strand:- start:82 stop:576 length:495 start_codon:yes stop_codon:yes gene_type:complete
MRVDIIDNFLPSYQFQQLYNTLLSYDFPWYYYNGILRPTPKGKKEQFQFVHTFYMREQMKSIHFPLIEYFIPFLNINKNTLYRIKSNMNPRTFFHRCGGYHTDKQPCSTTAVYYVNTNNGWTHIKGYGKVKSVENRMVIFDSSLLHAGYSCTDENVRVVLNFNY